MKNKNVAKSTKNGNLYIINFKKINRVKVVAFAKFLLNVDKVKIWYQRFGYLNAKSIERL